MVPDRSPTLIELKTWTLDISIPGQPISWNQAYRVGRVTRTGTNGRIRLGGDGQPVEASTIVKTKEAKAYTARVAQLAGWARNSLGWAGLQPEFIVVEFNYFLGRDIDCDNVMKLVDDGLETALGVDDKWFLPRAMSKIVGLRPMDRKLDLHIYPASG